MDFGLRDLAQSLVGCVLYIVASLKMTEFSLSLSVRNVDFTVWISISESQGHTCSFTVHFTDKKSLLFAKICAKDGDVMSNSALDRAALGNSIFPECSSESLGFCLEPLFTVYLRISALFPVKSKILNKKFQHLLLLQCLCLPTRF